MIAGVVPRTGTCRRKNDDLPRNMRRGSPAGTAARPACRRTSEVHARSPSARSGLGARAASFMSFSSWASPAGTASWTKVIEGGRRQAGCRRLDAVLGCPPEQRRQVTLGRWLRKPSHRPSCSTGVPMAADTWAGPICGGAGKPIVAQRPAAAPAVPGPRFHRSGPRGAGFLHVMGGQENRLSRPAQPFDQRPHAPAGRRVKPRGRLVQEQHLRIADQADGHVHPALLTAGQAPDALARLIRQASRGNCRVEIGRLPEVPCEHRDRFPYRVDGVELDSWSTSPTRLRQSRPARAGSAPSTETSPPSRAR